MVRCPIGRWIGEGFGRQTGRVSARALRSSCMGTAAWSWYGDPVLGGWACCCLGYAGAGPLTPDGGLTSPPWKATRAGAGGQLEHLLAARRQVG
jgi:hypothetical protein